MPNPKIKITMTFITYLELDPQLYPGCTAQEMIADERRNFSNRHWVMQKYFEGNNTPEYSYKMEEVKKISYGSNIMS